VTHEKEHRNLFGIINAITRAGQVFDEESWVKFDEIGGKMVGYTPDEWGSLSKYANTLPVKEVDEVFSAAAVG